MPMNRTCRRGLRTCARGLHGYLKLALGLVLTCTAAIPAQAIELFERQRPMLRLNAMAGPAADEQRQREKRDAETRARTLDEPDAHDSAPPPARPGDFPVLAREASCLRIDRFELVVPESLPASARRAGASALPQDPFAFAADWLAHYNDQCVGQQGLNTLATGLTREIVARGYLTTRVRVVEQDLSSGVLKFALVPGTIHEVRFTDPSMRTSWRNVFPARPGELLELADLEQALVQFEQVPGQNADIAIAPAEELGQSDVLVTLTRSRPWRVNAVIDNSGSYATGKVLGTLGASLDNPLGINDRLSASFSHDLMFGQRAQGSYGWSAFYAVPLGYWTTSLNSWGSHYYQRVAGRKASFVSTGESQIVEWQLARNLLRSRASTLGLEFRLGKRFGRGFIEHLELKSQRRNNTYVQLGVNGRQYFGAARLDATLSYRQGVPWLGARSDPAGFRATYLYRMGLLDANLRLPFAVGERPFLYTSAFHGQTTGNRLFRVDDIALGTRWSVRGFDGEEILSAERGFYWRNDIAMPLGRSGHAVYAGVDYGQLYGPNSTYLRGTRLAGAVLGIRGVAGSHGSASRAAAALPASSGRSGKLGAPATGQAGAVSATAASPVAEAGEDVASIALPGVLTYDLYAGAPIWKPKGFQTANITVGFQLAYWY